MSPFTWRPTDSHPWKKAIAGAVKKKRDQRAATYESNRALRAASRPLTDAEIKAGKSHPKRASCITGCSCLGCQRERERKRLAYHGVNVRIQANAPSPESRRTGPGASRTKEKAKEVSIHERARKDRS